MNILNETENKLLQRKEVAIKLEHDSNPDYTTVSAMLAEKFKVEEARLSINKIFNNYGSRSFTIDAFIYNSLEAKQKFEPKKKEKKGAS